MTLQITRDENGRITHIHSDGHVVLTGPIRGNLTLADGTMVDVTPPVVEVAGPEQAAEINTLIGQHWEATGHPDDVEWDEETQTLIQRPFVYVPEEG